MKTSITKLAISVVILFLSAMAFGQTSTITGTYDGFDVNGFNYKTISDKDGDDYISFPKIEESLIKQYDLNSDKALIGAKFEITYSIQTTTEEDEDGDEQEFDVYTLVSLKKVE